MANNPLSKCTGDTFGFEKQKTDQAELEFMVTDNKTKQKYILHVLHLTVLYVSCMVTPHLLNIRDISLTMYGVAFPILRSSTPPSPHQKNEEEKTA